MSKSRMFRKKSKHSFAKRHKEYLKTLRAATLSKDDSETVEKNKQKKVAEFGATLRAAILNGKSVRRFWKPAKAAAYLCATNTRSSSTLCDVSSAQKPIREGSQSFQSAPCHQESKTGNFMGDISLLLCNISICPAQKTGTSS